MDAQIRDLLLKDNAWLADPTGLWGWLHDHLPVRYLERLQIQEPQGRWSQVDKAHLVVGPRQAGKSTSIWQWLTSHGEPALFVDCEQPLLQRWCRSAPSVAADLAESFPEPPILFFEEIQHLEDAALFIKGLVDRKPGVPLLVTGSSSYALRARTRESLAGRATRTRLLPLSFAEVAAELETLPPLAREGRLAEQLHRHILFGGYPEVWLSDQPEILLTDLLESFLIRDASDLQHIKRPDAFRTLLSLAAKQVGSLVNISEWAQILGVSRDTVYAYLEILQSSHVLQLVRPFAGGRRSELTKRPKVYWLDTGLRNRLLADFRPLSQRQDLGALMENWVFTEIVKHMPPLSELFFWRNTSGAEVDFVLRSGESLLAMEVKAGGPARQRLPRATRSFLDAYHPGHLCVVGPGSSGHEVVSGTQVDWIPPAEAGAWVWQHLPRQVR